MCGIFGAICTDPAHANTVVDVLLALGKESEERGKDASGIAMLVADTDEREWTAPDEETVRKAGAGLDGVYVVKETAAFTKIDFAAYREVMERASVFLGHTRWATQGATDDKANASPLFAGALVGTHNGDVDVKSIPNSKALKKYAHGSTDTEMLYLALHLARKDRRKMTGLMKDVHGRAALAFVDRTRPDRLYLARTALSPLSFATDQHGNFYYASNPDWFRRIAAANPDVSFSDITLVPEGHLLTVNTLTAEIEDVRRFTPTVRESDARSGNYAAYRGFTDEDKAVDMTLQRHHVAQPSLGAWRTLTTVDTVLPVKGVKAAEETLFSASGDSLSAWRSTAPDYSFSDYGSLNDRLAAEEPDVWDSLDDGWPGPEEDTSSSTEEYDALEDPAINWQQVEDWCWSGGDFDHVTYERLADATSKGEAHAILKSLREQAENGSFSAEAVA